MPSGSSSIRCWAEINLTAICHNARVAQEAAGPGAALLAVVKANGYGHGMIPVARALYNRGPVREFGVANVIEAVTLRAELPDRPITILSPALPAERPDIVRHGFLPWVSTLAELRDYARLAVELCTTPFAVDLCVDTGMGREGALPEELHALHAEAGALPALTVRGIVTHLPSPDEDAIFTTAQLNRFAHLVAAESPVPIRHAQNSAGLLGYPLAPACNVVRPGLMLYGSSPLPEHQSRLRPALTWKTRVTLVRELPAGHGISYGRTFITPRPMRIGTLAAGYADGYPRHLSNAGAHVLVRGQRCPVLGRVTMDQILIDLTTLPGVEPGEEVVLLGHQGHEEIHAAELAEKSGTIAWEIFTSIGPRVIRVYTEV